jgi:hypothetical protein
MIPGFLIGGFDLDVMEIGLLALIAALVAIIGVLCYLIAKCDDDDWKKGGFA